MKEAALRKATEIACRASASVGALVLRANSAPVTDAVRNDLLAKCAAGEYVELDVDMLAYEQQDGVPNRNFVRFRNGALMSLGRSGVGKPFLRDHEQQDSLARGGTIIASLTDKRSESDYAMRMTARLTAPWAVDLALRNLLSGVSIGWVPTGPVECSVHQAPVGTECWCYPGMRLAESGTDAKGNKKYAPDRNGPVRAEWVYTDGTITECSVCNVPAVPSAGIDGIRAALAAGGIALPDALASEIDRPESHPQDEHMTETLNARITQLEGELATAKRLGTLTDAQRAHHAKLAADDAAMFLAKSPAERDAVLATIAAADPIVYTTLAGIEIRKSQGELMLSLAKQADDAQKKLDVANEANTLADLRQRAATELSHVAGDDDVKIAALRALDGIADEKLRAGAQRMLRSAAALATAAAKPKGVNPQEGAPDTTLQGQFDALVAKHVADHKCDERTARLAVVKTDKGRELYIALERAKRFGAKPALTA